MSSQLIVRTATPADVSALARLRYEFRTALAAPNEDAAIFIERCERWMAQRLAAGEAWRCWVAENGGEVVGTVWLHTAEKMPNPVDESEAYGYITNFFVREDVRGNGIGAALLTAALHESEAQQLRAVILWSTPRSRALYRRLGFDVRDNLLERRPRLANGVRQ